MNTPRGWERVRCVSFDAAGTLLHPHPSVGHVYQEIARTHGCPSSAEALNRAFRSAVVNTTKDAGLADPEARECEFWRHVVRNTLERAGARVTHFEPMFADLWEAFAHADRWRVDADAGPTLRALRKRGYRLAVISNWDRRLHTVLSESGLRDSFDAVIISSEAGHEKPHPGIFRVAEQALAAEAQECLHVGDSPRDDLEGARAAGWKGVLVDQSDGTPPEDGVNKLADLLALLPGRAPRPQG